MINEIDFCIPFASICREYGWNSKSTPGCQDPCVVCLERKCTVAAEGTLLASQYHILD